MKNTLELKRFLQRIQNAYCQNEQTRQSIAQIEHHLSQKKPALALMHSEKLIESLLKT